jgi:hypothetical protein
MGQLQQAIHYVSCTLETLTLELVGEGFRDSPAWSFQSFKSLKMLSIKGRRLWVPSPSEDIVDRLPPFLETLTFRITRRYMGTEKEIIEGFRIILTKKSPTILSHLKVFSCNNKSIDWSILKDMAAKKGVEIVPYGLICDE